MGLLPLHRVRFGAQLDEKSIDKTVFIKGDPFNPCFRLRLRLFLALKYPRYSLQGFIIIYHEKETR